VKIKGSFWVIALGGVVPLILFVIFYVSTRLNPGVYLLMGFVVIVNLLAATMWTVRLERMATRFGELDSLKSDFVSRVSHELRTPLTTIKALTRLMLRGEVTKEKQREYLETISIECDRQIDLVLNLLDLSRIEGGVLRLSPEKVNVEDVITSCVNAEMTSALRRGHKLRIGPLEGLRPIYADPKALRRVLGNLIENAIKYTANGGLISVFARTEDELVNIVIMDNGIGIPSEDLPLLFDKFHRGSPIFRAKTSSSIGNSPDFIEDADVSGVGLGLYVALDLMTRMDGQITVESEVGHGSTFTLKLPIWDEGENSTTLIAETIND